MTDATNEPQDTDPWAQDRYTAGQDPHPPPPPPVEEEPPPAGGWEYADMPADPATGEVHDEPDADPVVAALRGLQATNEDQQKQIDQILDMITATPDGPWNWAHLSGAARRQLWDRLYTWVTWLEDRYLRHLSSSRTGIPVFPADWYRHPVAVEMLTAMMVAHASAYRKKASPPSFALVEWHERCLWPTLARMEALGLFREGDANKDWGGPEQRPTRRNDQRFNDWMRADVDEHPDADSAPSVS